MHWLPLVAMVIASALPFPHSPVPRTVAATTEPGTSPDNRRKDSDDSPGRLAALAQPRVDYSFGGNASQKDHNMATALSKDTSTETQGTMHNKDYIKPSVPEELSTYKGKSQEESHQSHSNSISGDIDNISSDVPTAAGKRRTSSNDRHKDYNSQDNSVPEDYVPDSNRRADFGVKEKRHNSADGRTERHDNIRPLQTSVVETHNIVSHTAGPQGPKDLLVPRERPSNRAETGTGSRGQESRGAPGAGRGPEQPEEGLGTEAEPGLGIEMDGLPEGDDMLFLDAHPRVLFSPSPSPPNLPPLLLMLETGLSPEEAEEEEEDEGAGADGHIEGHGDRETDRNGPLSWADARPVVRNKRSHLSDTRRGERSVCESESVWVTDKETAIDHYGRTVTILPEIQTQTGALKQYFYETRCRRPEQRRDAGPSRGSRASSAAVGSGVAGAGCLGVDKKQWVSECKVKQSFVRALTKDANNRIGWRWIRIDSACVCVLLHRAARH